MSTSATVFEGDHFTLEYVKMQVAKLLQESPEEILEEDDLIGIWGMDSVRIMSLVEEWRRFGVEVTFMELAERPTISYWWGLLSARANSGLPNIDYFL